VLVIPVAPGASGVVVGSGDPEGVFARSGGVGGGTEGDFVRGSNACGGVATSGALRPRRSPMMRWSAGGAGRRSAAGPGDSASRRFCAPAGRAGGAAPLVGGRLGVPGRGKDGGIEGAPARMAVDAFDGDIADETFDGIPDDAFDGDIADETFDGIPDDAFDGIPDDAFDGDIPDDAFDGDIPDDAFDGIPGRIEDELVSAPGRIGDESFEEPPPCIDDASLEESPPCVDEKFDGSLDGVPRRIDNAFESEYDELDDGAPDRIDDDAFDGPLDGVPRRIDDDVPARDGDGLAGRVDLFSVVWPPHVSSTRGGGGSAGALSRITFVDVRSGTPSLRSMRGDVTSAAELGSCRGDDAACTAKGDVMSIVADVLGSIVADALGSTRVCAGSNWSTRVCAGSNWSTRVCAESNWSTRVCDESN
jgi:hypothetical protein